MVSGAVEYLFGYLGYTVAQAALAAAARVACAALLNRFVYHLSGALGLALPLLPVPYSKLQEGGAGRQ